MMVDVFGCGLASVRSRSRHACVAVPRTYTATRELLSLAQPVPWNFSPHHLLVARQSFLKAAPSESRCAPIPFEFSVRVIFPSSCLGLYLLFAFLCLSPLSFQPQGWFLRLSLLRRLSWVFFWNVRAVFWLFCPTISPLCRLPALRGSSSAR